MKKNLSTFDGFIFTCNAQQLSPRFSFSSKYVLSCNIYYIERKLFIVWVSFICKDGCTWYNRALRRIDNIFLIFVWRSSIIFARYHIRCRNLLRNTRDKSHYRYCRITVSLVQMLRSIDRVYRDRITIRTWIGKIMSSFPTLLYYDVKILV